MGRLRRSGARLDLDARAVRPHVGLGTGLVRAELAWPSTAGMLLLWAEILFAWFAIHYLLATDGMNQRRTVNGRPRQALVDSPVEPGLRDRPLGGFPGRFDPE